MKQWGTKALAPVLLKKTIKRPMPPSIILSAGMYAIRLDAMREAKDLAAGTADLRAAYAPNRATMSLIIFRQVT